MCGERCPNPKTQKWNNNEKVMVFYEYGDTKDTKVKSYDICPNCFKSKLESFFYTFGILPKEQNKEDFDDTSSKPMGEHD